MPVLETAPELKLSVAEISNLTEQLQEYCAIYNPLFRRAEQREDAEGTAAIGTPEGTVGNL